MILSHYKQYLLDNVFVISSCEKDTTIRKQLKWGGDLYEYGIIVRKLGKDVRGLYADTTILPLTSASV